MQYTMQYYDKIKEYLDDILLTEKDNILAAANLLADHIKKDQVIYIYGPGGHSNLASQELFFRAGGLMHISAILDEGTLLSGGALRSMAIERTPGYTQVVFDDYGLKEGDLLIIANAYGINTATIDAALIARQLGVKTIGVSSVKHSESTPADHPARHPKKENLHDLVDISIDSKVDVGDAMISVPGMDQPIGAVSTFANAFILNSLVIETISILVRNGIKPPIWKSGNATGGDEWNQQFIDKFKNKIKKI